MRRQVTGALSAGLVRVGLAVNILLGFSVLASAAEVAADVESYCRKTYGPDAFANVDRRDNGLMCSIRTDGGLGSRHHKIDAAAVCAAQHGTSRYRREGGGLICLTGTSDTAASSSQVIDLEKHCKSAYGPDAFVTTRTTDNRPMCTLRTDGGLGLRHHLIDLDGLCGGGTPRVEGTLLHCEKGGAGSAEKASGDSLDRRTGQGVGAPEGQNAGARPGGQSEEAEIAARPATGSLEGCAIFGGIADFGKLIGSDQKSVEQGGVAFPCPGLSGGWEADLHNICGDGSSGAGLIGKLDWQGDQPICRVQPVPQVPETIVKPPIWVACMVRYRKLTGEELFSKRAATPAAPPSGEAVTALAFRWDERKLHCFRVQKKAVDCYKAFLTDGSYPPECLEPEVAVQPIDVRFVQSEPPYDVIERLSIGQQFSVEVLFERDPERTSEPVTVTNEQTGETLELTAEQTDDPKVFRTPLVNLLPEVQP